MRIWHGVTAAARANEYLDYVKATGVKMYLGAKGNEESTCCVEFETTRQSFTSCLCGIPCRRCVSSPGLTLIGRCIDSRETGSSCSRWNRT